MRLASSVSSASAYATDEAIEHCLAPGGKLAAVTDQHEKKGRHASAPLL